MKYNKALLTNQIFLQIEMQSDNISHSRINASVESVEEFNEIVNATMSYFKGRVNLWEKQFREDIERVGK